MTIIYIFFTLQIFINKHLVIWNNFRIFAV